MTFGAPPPAPDTHRAVSQSSFNTARTAFAVIAVIALTVAAGVWWTTSQDADVSRSAATPASRVALQLTDSALALGRGSSVALSPDGTRLVYRADANGKIQLHVRMLVQSNATPIPNTDDATDPFFSPDGQSIGFFADGKLKKIALDGSAVAVTLADVPNPRGAAWGPGDVIYVTPRNNTGVWRVSGSGGTLEPVTTLADGELSHRWPQILAGDNALVYTIWNDNGWEPARIAIQPLAGGNRHIVLSGGGYGRIVSDASGATSLVYARDDAILVAPFSAATLATTGDAHTLIDGVMMNFSGGAHVALSETGTIAYVPGTNEISDRPLRWVGTDAATTEVTTIAGRMRLFALSPDATRIAYYRTDARVRDLWVSDLARPGVQITTHKDPLSTEAQVLANPPSLAWTHDGRSVAYASGVPLANLWLADVQSHRTTRLTTSTHNQSPSSWSPDGRTCAFVEFDPLSGADIWTLRLPDGEGQVATQAVLRTPFNELGPQISPDGRWLAYYSNESGRFEIYVQPFPNGGQRTQVSSTGGVYPRWSPQGDRLFFRGGPAFASMMSASLQLAGAPIVSAPAKVFDASAYDSSFAIAADGRRLLMMPLPAPLAAPREITVISNALSRTMASR